MEQSIPARDRVERHREADRVLQDFGYDPGQIEGFLRLTPAQRLQSLKNFTAFAARARAGRDLRSPEAG